jgi:hypothetical protein
MAETLTRDQLCDLQAWCSGQHEMEIGHAKEKVAALLALISADTQLLNEVAWGGPYGQCPVCVGGKDKHHWNCKLAARIALGEVDHGTA